MNVVVALEVGESVTKALVVDAKSLAERSSGERLAGLPECHKNAR